MISRNPNKNWSAIQKQKQDFLRSLNPNCKAQALANAIILSIKQNSISEQLCEVHTTESSLACSVSRPRINSSGIKEMASGSPVEEKEAEGKKASRLHKGSLKMR